MPIIKSFTRNSILHTYRLYEKFEIYRDRELYRELNLRGIMGKECYLSCAANCEDEALVLTALLLREIDNSPANFYYSKGWKKLFMCCYSTTISTETIELRYGRIAMEFVGKNNLKNITKDLDGEPLFWNRASEIEELTNGDGSLKQTAPFLYSYSPIMGSRNEYDFPFRL